MDQPSSGGRLVDVDVADGVGTVLLNRPDRLNSVTVSLSEQLEAAIRGLGERDDVNVVVLRRAGGNFSAGGDFDEVDALRRQGPRDLARLFDAFGRALTSISLVRQPVVAAVQGVAMAGGFELMQASDIVLIQAGARIRDTHVRFGLIPGGGATQRLPRLIGRQQTMAHLLSGEMLTADDVFRLGLAHRVIEADAFEGEVLAFASELAGRSPAAVARIKGLVNQALEQPLSAGLEAERAAVVNFISGPTGEASFAAFADRT